MNPQEEREKLLKLRGEMDTESRLLAELDLRRVDPESLEQSKPLVKRESRSGSQ